MATTKNNGADKDDDDENNGADKDDDDDENDDAAEGVHLSVGQYTQIDTACIE